MQEDELISMARDVRTRAYAPYSHFAVGAALLCSDGTVFTGCNVENISFGLTSCAERNAFFTAKAAGKSEFQQIVVISDSEVPVSACGACRQVMAEFCEDLEILSVNLEGLQFRTRLLEFLPRAKVGILGGST
jgi:cytidine deaminase